VRFKIHSHECPPCEEALRHRAVGADPPIEPRQDFATIDRFRSFDSLSSTLTMRSNTGGGGPSIDSKAIVEPPPLEAIANEPLAAPPPAQPPSAHATTSNAAAIIARVAFRQRS